MLELELIADLKQLDFLLVELSKSKLGAEKVEKEKAAALNRLNQAITSVQWDLLRAIAFYRD